MVEPATVGLVLVGLAFLFFGATFSSWGVSALGLVVGAVSGYLLAPSIAGALGVASLGATAALVLVGAVVGILLGYALLSLAVGAIAFLIGTYVGLSALAELLVDGGTLIEIPVAIGIGLVCAVIGTFLTKTMMVILTAFVGAALASMAVTPESFLTARANVTLDPLLFDVTAPLFLGLFVLGILAQFGLFKFGYVARLLTILPGVRPLRNKRARGE